jgi:hypothetical protein
MAYKHYDEHNYDNPVPGEYQKKVTEAYREGWERVFGNKKEAENEHIGGCSQANGEAGKSGDVEQGGAGKGDRSAIPEHRLSVDGTVLRGSEA